MFSVVRPFLIAVIAVALALPAVAGPRVGGRLGDGGIVVQAQDDGGRGRGRGRGGYDAPQLLPLEVVLGNVAARFPGHHLGVDGPAFRDGRWIYRIKWLTPDGRVLIVFADAQTGQVLGHRG
ncbi:MAG: PepSY domain-containing protein [Micropepsaceae bacterium]